MRKWLKEARLRKKMTHNDVASKTKIKRAYYTMIENGHRTPSVNVAKRIARVLDFDWIIFFNDESNKMTHRQDLTGSVM